MVSVSRSISLSHFPQAKVWILRLVLVQMASTSYSAASPSFRLGMAELCAVSAATVAMIMGGLMLGQQRAQRQQQQEVERLQVRGFTALARSEP